MCPRSFMTLFVAGLAAYLASAPHASAYVLEGPRALDPTITYYNAAPQHDWAVARAIRAWESSGAQIEFRPAPRREAALVFRYMRGESFLGGLTTQLNRSELPADHRAPEPGDTAIDLPRLSPSQARGDRFVVALIVAHELGHVLGLGHDDVGCATMNSSIAEDAPAGCGHPPPGQWRCRLVERDDARGAVEVYGGHARQARRPPFCPTEPPPPPPADLTLRARPRTGEVRLRWRNRSGVTKVVTARGSSCPPRSGVRHRRPVSSAGRPTGEVTYPLELERTCYAAWSRDGFGRLSRRPATATFRPPPPPAAPTDALVTRSVNASGGALGATLRWRNPADAADVVVARATDDCATRSHDAHAGGDLLPAVRGRAQSYSDLRFSPGAPERYCYTLWSMDRFGRLSNPVALRGNRSAPGEVVLTSPSPTQAAD